MVTSDKATKDRVVDWVASQSFNNILLLLILGAVCWAAYYAITTAVPAHLQMIQDGYKSLDTKHREEREQIRIMYDKWIRSIDKASHVGGDAETPSTVVKFGSHD